MAARNIVLDEEEEEEDDQLEEEDDEDMREDEMADFTVDEEIDVPIRRIKSKKRLENEFEPSFLAEKYLTPKDHQIRETDVPERIQLAVEITGPVPQNENTTREAKWIYEQMFGKLAVPMRKEFRYIANMDREEVVKEIANVLQLFYDQKFEVPFIAMYRKELCLNLKREEVKRKRKRISVEGVEKEKKPKLKTCKALWAIELWDRRWLLLQREKNALRASYEKHVGEEALRDPMKLTLLQSCFQSLHEAGSERTVDDIDAKFNLHFSSDEAELEGQFNGSKRKSMYSICHESGLGALSGIFGLNSEGFALNRLSMHKELFDELLLLVVTCKAQWPWLQHYVVEEKRYCH